MYVKVLSIQMTTFTYNSISKYFVLWLDCIISVRVVYAFTLSVQRNKTNFKRCCHLSALQNKVRRIYSVCLNIRHHSLCSYCSAIFTCTMFCSRFLNVEIYKFVLLHRKTKIIHGNILYLWNSEKFKLKGCLFQSLKICIFTAAFSRVWKLFA